MMIMLLPWLTLIFETSQHHTDPNHVNAMPVTTTMYAQDNWLFMEEEEEWTTEQPAQQVISMSSPAEERAYGHPQCITCTLSFVFGNAKKRVSCTSSKWWRWYGKQ